MRLPGESMVVVAMKPRVTRVVSATRTQLSPTMHSESTVQCVPVDLHSLLPVSQDSATRQSASWAQTVPPALHFMVPVSQVSWGQSGSPEQVVIVNALHRPVF